MRRQREASRLAQQRGLGRTSQDTSAEGLSPAPEQTQCPDQPVADGCTRNKGFCFQDSRKLNGRQGDADAVAFAFSGNFVPPAPK